MEKVNYNNRDLEGNWIMKLIKVPISKLRPNPYRRIDDYPIQREKVDALVESFQQTGFWGNIVARPAKNGTYEIAYGHHRHVALKEFYGPNKDVFILTNRLTNADMVQMMARENLEEWGTSAYIEAETLEATIEAYGKGEIELPEVPAKTNVQHIRYAPASKREHPYTKATVAEFLGWTRKHKDAIGPNQMCEVAFAMLDAIRDGIVTRQQLKGLSRDVAHEIVQQAVAVRNEQQRLADQRLKEAEAARKLAESAEATKKASYSRGAAALEKAAKTAAESVNQVAKDFAKDAVKSAKSGQASVRDIHRAGQAQKANIRASRSTKEAQYKTAAGHFQKYSSAVSQMLNNDLHASMLLFLQGDYGLTVSQVKSHRHEVESLVKRAERYAEQLRKWTPATPSEDSDVLSIVG